MNYDEHNWKLLTEYLKSDKYENIPEMTRSKLLYDVFNLAYFGEVGIETALNMSLFLSKETSKTVWEPFLNMINEFIEYISDTPAELLLEVSLQYKNIFVSNFVLTSNRKSNRIRI